MGATTITESDIIPDIREILAEKIKTGAGINIEETLWFRLRVREVIEHLHGDTPTTDNMEQYHQARAEYHYLAGFISRGDFVPREDIARTLELLDSAMDATDRYFFG